MKPFHVGVITVFINTDIFGECHRSQKRCSTAHGVSMAHCGHHCVVRILRAEAGATPDVRETCLPCGHADASVQHAQHGRLRLYTHRGKCSLFSNLCRTWAPATWPQHGRLSYILPEVSVHSSLISVEHGLLQHGLNMAACAYILPEVSVHSSLISAEHGLNMAACAYILTEISVHRCPGIYLTAGKTP